MNANDVLGGLVEKATKGPWILFAGTPGFRRTNPKKPTHVEVREAASTVPVVSWGGFDDGDRTKEEHAANGALIVAAVNALPLLLAVAAEARKVIVHTSDFGLETALARLDGEVG